MYVQCVPRALTLKLTSGEELPEQFWRDVSFAPTISFLAKFIATPHAHAHALPESCESVHFITMSAFPFQPPIGNPPSDPPLNPGRNNKTATAGERNVAYKDQVREVPGDQEAVVPVAAAVPVSESRISNEENVALEQENLKHQRRILELERQQMEAERQLEAAERERQAQRQQQQPQQSRQQNNGLSKKQWIAVGSVIALLLLVVVTVVGVCASGNCGIFHSRPCCLERIKSFHPRPVFRHHQRRLDPKPLLPISILSHCPVTHYLTEDPCRERKH